MFSRDALWQGSASIGVCPGVVGSVPDRVGIDADTCTRGASCGGLGRLKRQAPPTRSGAHSLPRNTLAMGRNASADPAVPGTGAFELSSSLRRAHEEPASIRHAVPSKRPRERVEVSSRANRIKKGIRLILDARRATGACKPAPLVSWLTAEGLANGEVVCQPRKACASLRRPASPSLIATTPCITSESQMTFDAGCVPSAWSHRLSSLWPASALERLGLASSWGFGHGILVLLLLLSTRVRYFLEASSTAAE